MSGKYKEVLLMQSEYAVVRAIGKDRIGIVGDLSTLIQECGCNIEESSMSVLGGEFAVMILVSGNSASLENLLSYDFSSSEVQDLQIDVVRTQVPDTVKKGIPYQIRTVSLDSPGIVHSVTTLLSEQGVNVEQLETDSVPAPFTGAPMFTMTIRVVMDGPKHAHKLREQLDVLAAERDLDITYCSLAELR
jgi:glycine cleavage system transcriptional repressor